MPQWAALWSSFARRVGHALLRREGFEGRAARSTIRLCSWRAGFRLRQGYGETPQGMLPIRQAQGMLPPLEARSGSLCDSFWGPRRRGIGLWVIAGADEAGDSSLAGRRPGSAGLGAICRGGVGRGGIGLDLAGDSLGGNENIRRNCGEGRFGEVGIHRVAARRRIADVMFVSRCSVLRCACRCVATLGNRRPCRVRRSLESEVGSDVEGLIGIWLRIGLRVEPRKTRKSRLRTGL